MLEGYAIAKRRQARVSRKSTYFKAYVLLTDETPIMTDGQAGSRNRNYFESV